MKIYFYISVAASALCLLLSIILFWEGGTNTTLQNEVQAQQVKLQQQQEEINKGTAIQQQVGPNLLNDMAVSSVKNEKMKQLLAKNGYTVNVATPAPGSSPAPAKGPATTPAASEPGRLQP
jgi:hypothetical protein